LKTTERNHHSLTYTVLKPVIAFIYLTENMRVHHNLVMRKCGIIILVHQSYQLVL